MTIWVDADSMPRDVRQLLLRRAEKASRLERPPFGICFVASKMPSDVPGKYAMHAEAGPDSADLLVENAARPGDIVVTRDLPFAERIAMKGIPVINDRGMVFTKENVAERRSLRDAALELRALGIAGESPRSSSRTARDTKLFADSLDRLLAKLARPDGQPGR